MTSRTPRFDTLSLHAGQRPDPTTGARAVPIYQTTSFVFKDTEHAAGLFNLERPGHIYSRISNPTVAVFEERMAALEGGVGAVATASGQAALHLADLDADGGWRAYRRLVPPLWRIAQHVRAHAAAIRHRDDAGRSAQPRELCQSDHTGRRGSCSPRRSAIPASRCSISRLSPTSRTAHGLPLMIDSTFATPYLCRPIEHGADIVMHSATKFIGGHGIAIGGVIVDGGRFDWAASASSRH